MPDPAPIRPRLTPRRPAPKPNTMMLSLLLALAPALSSAPADHAALHPADATFYLSFPDLRGAASAYEQAPLARMLADEDVHAALAAFGLPTDDLSFDKLVQGALAQALGEHQGLATSATALSFSVTLGGREPSPETTGLELVAEFQSAESALEAEALVREKLADPEDATRLVLDVGGTKLGGWTAAEGQRLLLGGGTCTLESVNARLHESAGGLAADGLFQSTGAKLPGGSGAVLLRGFLRDSLSGLGAMDELPGALRSLVQTVEPLPGPTAFRMNLEGQRFVTRAFSATDAQAKVLGVRPVDGEWLKLVQPGAMFVYGGSLDASALAGLLQAAMGDLGLDEASVERAKAALPVFQKLGPEMVCYAQPITGIGLPQSFLWARVSDPAGIQEELAAALTELLGVYGVEVSTRDYKVKDEASGERIPFPITTLKLPEGALEGPLNVSPSFTVVDGKLLATLTSVHIKRELKRLHGDEGEGEAVEGVDPLVAAGFQLPKDARSVMVMDWGALIDGLFGMAKTFGGLASGFAGEGGLPFDIEKLPPSEIFTRHFRPTIHTTRRVDGGLLRVHEASFGPETIGTLMGGILVLPAAMMGGMVPPPSPPEPR